MITTIGDAQTAFEQWRMVPAPHRCELVRLFGQELRVNKPLLGKSVSIESGKIRWHRASVLSFERRSAG